MRGLYAIIDMTTLATRGIDPLKLAQAIVDARPAAVQLRAKQLEAREILSVLRALAPICHRVRVPLVANDRPDLAMLAGCDMVHVGQSDIGIDLVRRIAPGITVGISTHTPAQLTTALAHRPAYVAYGPVWPTTTKADPDPTVGLAGLREAHRAALLARVPLVAIGGITLDRINDVAQHADAAAVIAGLLPLGPRASQGDILAEVSARAAAFQQAFVRTAPLAEVTA